MGGDTRPVGGRRLPPLSSQTLSPSERKQNGVDILPLCAAVWTQRTETRLQQMSRGADYK